MNPVHEIQWDDNDNAVACTQSPNELFFTDILEKVLLASYCESQWPLILPHLCELNLWELHVQPLTPSCCWREKMWVAAWEDFLVSESNARAEACEQFITLPCAPEGPKVSILPVENTDSIICVPTCVPAHWHLTVELTLNFSLHNQLTAMINMLVIPLIRMRVKAIAGHMQCPR